MFIIKYKKFYSTIFPLKSNIIKIKSPMELKLEKEEEKLKKFLKFNPTQTSTKIKVNK